MSELSTAFYTKPAFKGALIAAIVLLAGLFIWQVNAASTAGFTMRELEQKEESLTMELKRLDMEVAELRSVESVASRVKMLGLVDAGSVTYVTGETAVAIGR
jgi:cell division protein FtsL